MQPLQRGTIRLAATILLVRDVPGGPEVFMMQRPGGVDFPDLHVFPDRVAYFSHWITPEQASRRFDTRFFIAAMADDQQTIAHHRETADDECVRPRDALAAFAAGRWQVIAPTVTTLEGIAGYASATDMLEAVAAEAHPGELTDELRLQGMRSLR